MTRGIMKGVIKMKKIISLCLCAVIMLSLQISVYAMPQPGNYFSENAKNATITTIGDRMDITATKSHSVIKFNSFDVKENETVNFYSDDYLVLIYDDAPTTINGNIKGSANIYLVNPNGFVFDDKSQIDVNNLFVSTRPIDQSIMSYSEHGQLSETDAQPQSDITVLGTVTADSVFFEGNEVFISNSAVNDIPADKITVISNDNETSPNLSSTISEGNMWIVAAVGVVAVAVAAAVVIAKKKKKE